MVESELPAWASSAGVIATAVVGVVVGVLKYVKTLAPDASKTTATSTPEVVTASFVDSKLLKQVIEAAREHQEESARENKKMIRSNTDLKEALQENTEQIILQTDGLVNLLRFISKANRPKLEEE